MPVDNGFVRGSTPEYSYIADGVDLTGQTLYVAVTQGNRKVQLTGDRLLVAADETGTTIAFDLTQEETLYFQKGSAEIEGKAIDATGYVTPLEPQPITVQKTTIDEVIEYVPGD